MTPVQRLADYVRSRYDTTEVFENLVSNLLAKEKRNVEDAIMYALDEDGHTGEWKIKFANDYITKHHENSASI
jgi:site-specific DNA-cytosine methylase